VHPRSERPLPAAALSSMKVEDVSYAFVRQHNKANHDKFEVDVFVASFFASRMIFGEVNFASRILSGRVALFLATDCLLLDITRLTPMILFEFAFGLPDTAVESAKRNATARSCCQIKCDSAYRARLACQCVASQFEIGLRSPGAVIR
jgi:hypothetical protein